MTEAAHLGATVPSGEPRSNSQRDDLERYPATEWLDAPVLQSDLAGFNVRQLAAEGYFQAIAYWLNEPLVPQNIYAQVLSDTVPGRLKVLVEYERAPQPKKLLSFICHRLHRLNSPVIEGVYLIARMVGTSTTDWAQRVRLPRAAQRQSEEKTPVSVVNPSSPTSPQVPQLMHESSRSQVAREIVRSQFNFFRAALMTGSATAAFLFGGLTELIMSDRLSGPVVTEPARTLVRRQPSYSGILSCRRPLPRAHGRSGLRNGGGDSP